MHGVMVVGMVRVMARGLGLRAYGIGGRVRVRVKVRVGSGSVPGLEEVFVFNKKVRDRGGARVGVWFWG